MRSTHNMYRSEAGHASQHLMMKVLALVTEIMVDDVALAEQMRAAAMTLWLAEQRGRDPRHAAGALGEQQRSERELRCLLFEAQRQGYLRPERFQQFLEYLNQLRRHQPIVAALPRRHEECTGQFTM